MRSVIVGTPEHGRRDRHAKLAIAIVHDDEHAQIALAEAFSDGPYEVTVADPADTLERARHLVGRHPSAMVVALRGGELIPDVRSLLALSEKTAFVFLVPRIPPHPALARVVREHGSAVLARDEPAVVVVATVVSLLARHTPRQYDGGQGS